MSTFDTIDYRYVNPDGRVPSRQADAGWRAFVLHTRDYVDLRERVEGRFIDHVPDETHTDPAAGQQASVRTTVEAMRAAGLPVDDIGPITDRSACMRSEPVAQQWANAG